MEKPIITKIWWENIWLHINVANAGDKEFVLKHTVYTDLYGFEQYKKGDITELVLNITLVNKDYFLPKGKYILGYKKAQENANDSNFERIDVAEDIQAEIENLSKIFRYDGLSKIYLFSLSPVSLDDTGVQLQIISSFMKENNRPKKKKEKFIKKIKIYVIRFIYWFFALFLPKKGKNILLLTETSKHFSGNLKYFKNKLYDRGIEKEFNIKLSTREMVGNNHSVFNWIGLIIKIAWADYIFIDNYAPIFTFINLAKKTKLIQLWHAGVGFKSVGYSRFGKEGTPHPYISIHRKYDYALAPSQSLIDVYVEVFGIPKEKFLPFGMPRLEGFLETKKIEEFKTKFYKKNPELKGKKLILFAPTYRGAGQASAYYDFSKIDCDKLYEFLGEDYVFAFKMHPFTKMNRAFYEEKENYEEKEAVYENRIFPDIEKYKDKIIDLTKAKYDINDLLYVTDLLITDYSSVYYEFSLFEKPILFYTYDRVLYEATRGVHKSVNETAPGKVCDTFEELLDAIRAEDFEIEKTKQFNIDNFPKDINSASDRLIDFILLKREDNDG